MRDGRGRGGCVFGNHTAGVKKTVPLRKGFGLQDTWRALEACVDAGLIRSLGVSNFRAAVVNDVLCYCKHKPVCNQIEFHPYLQQPTLLRSAPRAPLVLSRAPRSLKRARSWLESVNVAVVAYAPLGGTGTHRPRPRR